MKYDIFVSYRRADREVVASVVRRLEARGVGVWYDADIEGGADWRETIVEALTASDMLAIFFSDECNNSRQLKKELAVADTLGKPVVPILIEDTQPRGAYLYELADRNWIQVFPDPMAHIDELVEHLVTLAGKSEGGLGGKQSSDALKSKIAPAPAPANDVEPTLEEREQKLDDAIGEMINEVIEPGRAAPKQAKAYVGRASDPGHVVQRRDFLPFKWLDLIVLLPMFAAIGWFYFVQNSDQPIQGRWFLAGVLAVFGLSAFGAVVFPVRYYLRRRSIASAFRSYMASTICLFALAAPLIIFEGLYAGRPMDQVYAPVTAFLAIWVAFAVVAFLIYGVLAGQRAIRSFRSNIKKL